MCDSDSNQPGLRARPGRHQPESHARAARRVRAAGRVHGAQQPHVLRVLVGADAARADAARLAARRRRSCCSAWSPPSFGLTVTVAGGVRHLGRLIEDGDLDTLLTQPRSVLVYALGMRSQPSGVGDLISGLVFIATSGAGVVAHGCRCCSPRSSPARSSSWRPGSLFFSLAFWLGNVETMARQLWELLITFSLYPEPLFGGVLRLALFTVLPAGFVGYLPVRVVHAPSVPLVCLLVLGAARYLGARRAHLRSRAASLRVRQPLQHVRVTNRQSAIGNRQSAIGNPEAPLDNLQEPTYPLLSTADRKSTGGLDGAKVRSVAGHAGSR